MPGVINDPTWSLGNRARISLNACATENCTILSLLAMLPCETVKYNDYGWKISIQSEGIMSKNSYIFLGS